MQRLGVWASSKEELKPMRGFRENIQLFLGAWNAKTLKPGWFR
jgi:hypothetical protein